MSEIMYIEVQASQDSSEQWKDMTLNTGAAQSTLQDIKLQDVAGSYMYIDSPVLGSVTSNRFIYWRTNNNVLELVETSLDVKLVNNHLRLHFQHTPVLDGISIHETQNQVVILVCTVASVHRLLFPHPRRTKGGELGPSTEAVFSSILYEGATLVSFLDSSNFHLLNQSGVGSPVPHTSCTWLNKQNDAIFALANSFGSVLVLCLASPQNGGKVTTFEISRTSVISRLWNGIVPSVMSRGSQEGADSIIALVSHSHLDESFIFALCKDFNVRIWPYQKRECVLTASVLEYCGEISKATWNNLSGRQPCLRKAVCLDTSTLCLAVFLSLKEGNRFCIFQSVFAGGQCELAHIMTVGAPQDGLVEFCVTLESLWTLWVDGNSDPIVRFMSFNRDGSRISGLAWVGVSLLPTVAWNLWSAVADETDQEIYLEEIFFPGRFSVATIVKAISIYCHGIDTGMLLEMCTAEMWNSETLRFKVISAVENEIHARANETELSDDEFIQLQVDCWERFFSYCVQYHEVSAKVLGLFADSKTGIVTLIRKNSLSLLRTCDALETLLLSESGDIGPEVWMESSLLPNNPAVCASVLTLLGCVQLLRQKVVPEILSDFNRRLFYLHSPEDAASLIVQELEVTMSNQGLSLVSLLNRNLKTAPNLIGGLETLLECVDLTKWNGEEINWDLASAFTGEDDGSAYGHLFNSPIGSNILSASVQQTIKLRYELCRDLLILEIIIGRLGEKCGLSVDQANKLTSHLTSLTATFIQGYFVMIWTTISQASTTVKANTLESGLSELSLLSTIDGASSLGRRSKQNPLTYSVSHHFVLEQGGSCSRTLLGRLYQAGSSHVSLSSLLLSMRTLVLHLMWPISVFTIFPEFLLYYGQYLQLQDYVRLLQSWCEWNSCSRLFLLGHTYLKLGEPVKAVDLFCQAAKGVTHEEFFNSKIVRATDNNPETLVMHYYLKIAELLKSYNLPDCIIQVATAAVSTCAENHPTLSTLWSLIFKYHLDMDHCDEAYTAMTRHPDPSSRKDCLRQFLVVLFERGRLRDLVQYPFIDMQDDVISILEFKARSLDVTTHKYYEFLYAFHLKCNNFRRAATSMYEYAMRLGQEVVGVEGLSKQASCLLTTINCLHLVDPNYSWIVKPVPTNSEDRVQLPSMSPKRNFEGDRVEQSFSRTIEVLELQDIRREYDLVRARLLLFLRDPHSTNLAASRLSAQETVSLLVSEDMFNVAVNLSRAYQLPLNPIFEELASRCSKSVVRNHSYREELDWLEEGDTLNLSSTESASDGAQLWRLLKNYIDDYEERGQTRYHRCVAEKLLSLGASLPTWLKHSYRDRDCAELMRMYLRYDFVRITSELMMEYIDTVLRQRDDYSDLKNLRLWLPYTLLDQLLSILHDNSFNQSFKELYESLTSKLDEYNSAVESLTALCLQHARNVSVDAKNNVSTN